MKPAPQFETLPAAIAACVRHHREIYINNLGKFSIDFSPPFMIEPRFYFESHWGLKEIAPEKYIALECAMARRDSARVEEISSEIAQTLRSILNDKFFERWVERLNNPAYLNKISARRKRS